MRVLQIFGALLLFVALVSTHSKEIPEKAEDRACSVPSNCAAIKDLQEQFASLRACQERQKKALSYLKGASRIGEKLFISKGEEATYDEAVKICSKNGGQLALPRNADDNEAILSVRNQFDQDSYLAINDRQREGVFKYPMGGNLQYSNWLEGQPGHSDGNGHCALIGNSGQWRDQDCAKKALVICEFKI